MKKGLIYCAEDDFSVTFTTRALNPLKPYFLLFAHRLTDDVDIDLKRQPNSKDQKSKKITTDKDKFINREALYVVKWADNYDPREFRRRIKKFYKTGWLKLLLEIEINNFDNMPYYKLLLPKYLIRKLFIQNKKQLFESEQIKLKNEYFKSILNNCRLEINNQLIDDRSFFDFIDKLTNIAYKLDKGKVEKEKDRILLNELAKVIGKRENAIIDFLYKFLESIINKLLKDKIFKKCNWCRDLMFYGRPDKQHCQPKTEGKDCSKNKYNTNYNRLKNSLPPLKYSLSKSE